MTREEMLAVKARVLAAAHLFSARHTGDYAAMAGVVNEGRAEGDKLTALELHMCMESA
jgi:hypothetical protein